MESSFDKTTGKFSPNIRDFSIKLLKRFEFISFFRMCFSQTVTLNCWMLFWKCCQKVFEKQGVLHVHRPRSKRGKLFFHKIYCYLKCFSGHLDCSYDNPTINLMNKNRKVLLWNWQSMKSTITFQNNVSSPKFGQKHFSWTHGKQLLQPCELPSSKLWKFVTQCPQNVAREQITLENCFSPKSYSTVRMLLWQNCRKLSTKGLRFSNKVPEKVLIFLDVFE